MKYYLHDSTSFSDEKITMLYLEHGYEGLGLFYTILEKLAQQEKPINTRVLKSQLNVGKKLERCWSFLEQIELISSNNGETFNENILNFSKKYQVNKEKNREKISQWRENQQDKKIVTGYEPSCNAPKVKESKVKEVIELNDEWLEPFNLWLSYKKERNQSYKPIGISTLVKTIKKEFSTLQEFESAVEFSISKNYAGIYKSKEVKQEQVTYNKPKAYNPSNYE